MAAVVHADGRQYLARERTRWRRTLSLIGGGVRLQCRVFCDVNLDLRVGAAYRPEANDGTVVHR